MWALIEWTEIDASLDIVKKKDILQKVINEGDVVDVKYEDESSPAILLKLSENKDKLLKRLQQIESERKQKVEGKLPEKRTIKRKEIFSPENSPSPSPQKRRRKVEEPHADILLFKKIEEKAKEKSELVDLRREVKVLKGENLELKALNFKLQKDIINRFEELLPKTNITRSVAPTCPPATSPKNAPHPANQSHHVEINRKLNITKETFQACGRGGTSWSAMIKDLAVAVFGRSILATHGLSGKPGNANKGSQPKPLLDRVKVELILDTVQGRFPDTPRKFLRASFREKLNDEHKMLLRQEKRHVTEGTHTAT